MLSALEKDFLGDFPFRISAVASPRFTEISMTFPADFKAVPPPSTIASFSLSRGRLICFISFLVTFIPGTTSITFETPTTTSLTTFTGT